MPNAYFFDTSALLPRLLASAPGSAWVRHLCDPSHGNAIAIAEIAEVEIASALNQLRRGRVIRKKRSDQALEVFWNHVDGGQYNIFPVTTAIVRRAAALCDQHPLRGYDAVHLACSLMFRESLRTYTTAHAAAAFGDPIFLTEDNRLSDAARAEGFVVDTPLAHP